MRTSTPEPRIFVWLGSFCNALPLMLATNFHHSDAGSATDCLGGFVSSTSSNVCSDSEQGTLAARIESSKQKSDGCSLGLLWYTRLRKFSGHLNNLRLQQKQQQQCMHC
eukprot:TRINITY_DN107437_c0_g1_i1.p2 TRINITY_DN107437_c0_g1~~TRINITY_DN107437_c0_g1_i1.p2  ORF type:complete len:109 (-),score=15.77 TRINITY_DN107437_c0_g1_i1:51-377(-)